MPAAYFKAGVREFWLADARHDPVVFHIHHRSDGSYEPTTPDAEGFQASAVMACSYRLDSRKTARGYWAFDLREHA